MEIKLANEIRTDRWFALIAARHGGGRAGSPYGGLDFAGLIFMDDLAAGIVGCKVHRTDDRRIQRRAEYGESAPSRAGSKARPVELERRREARMEASPHESSPV